MGIVKAIEDALQEMRPAIQMDGGDIEYVDFKDGIVSLRLHGACASCPLSLYTLKLGIEERLKELVPDVLEVRAVQ